MLNTLEICFKEVEEFFDEFNNVYNKGIYKIPLPGFSEDDVSIVLKNNFLRIKASNKDVGEDIVTGVYIASMNHLDVSDLDVVMKNGLLIIKINMEKEVKINKV
jgi:HSP20 family molecular chaperone IbpA